MNIENISDPQEDIPAFNFVDTASIENKMIISYFQDEKLNRIECFVKNSKIANTIIIYKNDKIYLYKGLDILNGSKEVRVFLNNNKYIFFDEITPKKLLSLLDYSGKILSVFCFDSEGALSKEILFNTKSETSSLHLVKSYSTAGAEYDTIKYFNTQNQLLKIEYYLYGYNFYIPKIVHKFKPSTANSLLNNSNNISFLINLTENINDS